jgi:hypothetical protein
MRPPLGGERKRGLRASDWRLARRPDEQAPRADRRERTVAVLPLMAGNVNDIIVAPVFWTVPDPSGSSPTAAMTPSTCYSARGSRYPFDHIARQISYNRRAYRAYKARNWIAHVVPHQGSGAASHTLR